MSSSLAAQLAQGASLNSAQLLERTRRKPTESYLFSGRDANQHDLESLHALASSAFAQLKTLNATLAVYEDTLFSDASRLTDRTLLPAEARAELDAQLSAFLPRLGKHLMEVPTGRVIEWLVRRFRVHEFNVPDVLALFLPYHDSPHFTKMVSILHVQSNATWSFLSAHGQANVPLRRHALVDQMRRNPDVARFAAGLLPRALQGVYAHRTVISFHTGVLLEYVESSKTMDSNASAIILPPIVDSIKAAGTVSTSTLNTGLAKDVVLSSYILLSAFSSKSHLTTQAIAALLSSVASGASKVTSQQLVAVLLSILVPQDLQPSLPPAVIKKLVDLEDTSSVLIQILAYANSEKLLFPLSAHLISAQSTDERCHSILKAILSAPDVPVTVVVHIAGQLLRTALEGGERLDLLKDVRQRHSDALDLAAQELGEGQEEVQALLLSLAQTNGDADPTLASMDTQDTVRAAGITDIYKRMDKANAEELPTLHGALLARIADPSPEVLRALYSSPGKLAPVVLSDLSAYTSTLGDLVSLTDTEVLKLHLDFLLLNVGSKCDEKASQDIFGRLLFPLLLFSRDRRAPEIAWDAISSAFESVSGIGEGLLAHPMLSGCVEVLEEVKAPLFARSKKKKNKPLEKGEVASMGAVDLALASRMADNMMLRNDAEPYLSFLLDTLSSSSPHARALASLVLRAYIGRLSGPSQIDAAQHTVSALSAGLSLAALDEFADVNAMLSDEGLGSLVSSKPKSAVTQAWLSASLLATCAASLRPSGAMSFISSSDEGAPPYARLSRGVYTLLNTSQAPPTVSAHILRTLFARLGADALALLAGTWLSSTDSKLQHTALAHAYAYLMAHSPSSTSLDSTVVDFQTILPSLLVALTYSDKSVRQAAAHCISALDNVCKASSANSVYAFDSIYGSKSEELQYLDWADMRKFVSGLCADRAKFADDGEGLRVWVMEGLKEGKIKKKLDYKQKILVYILSHAAACPAISARLALLRLTQPVRSVLKARTLRPLLEELAEGGGKLEAKLAALALSCVDKSCVEDLEEDGDGLWSVLVKLAGVFVRDDAAPEPRDVLLKNLEGFAPALSAERRFELARVLLKIGAGETELAMLRPVLETLFTDGRLVVRLLITLQPPAADTVSRAAKRAKVDSSSTVAAELTPEMAELSTFADMLGNAPLPGLPELLTALLETLGRVVKTDVGKAGLGRSEAVYIQQRLMAALERAASSVTVSVPASALRVDVLVDIIRSTDAPQTSHQALLLLASLARLAPESVLHNVMPVFTFMGSNVLHRDDSYSFRVIQKTVDSIVPVMVEDLKAKFNGKLELEIGARDFVRVFTDAANHIPRHRRTQFFMHLVDVLGPDDFLGLVCMLFISKTANKVVRQIGDDLLATLALPIALVHHYPAETQRAVLRDVLGEADRLIAAALDPDAEHRIVLDTTHDDEQNSQSAALLRRRAHALLVFVGAAVERSTSLYTDDTASTDAVNELLSSLLDLAQSSGKEEGLKEIRAAAQTAVGQCLRVVPATSFIAAVGTILDVPKPRVQLEALTLLTERIALVADDARKAASADVGQIVAHLKSMLEPEGKKAKELVPHALVSLRAVAASALPGEENALVETVPLVINQASAREHVGEAVAALVPLCTALGPRIIPHFRDVVRECIALLRFVDLSDNVHADALSVLRALFSSIPSFWSGSQLTALFALYLDAADLDGLRAFVRQIASKAQPSVIFPALFDVWTQLEKDDSRSAEQCATYFELAKRVFRAAQRPAVLEHLRQAFQVLLAGLDLRSNIEEEEIDAVEDAVVGAFVELVTKLNETAFRPLFRRLFDWAFGDAASSDRKVAFLHAYSALLDNFKALMTPYLSIVLEPLLSVLDAFVGESEDEEEDGSLWAAALDVLAKSMAVDEGAFWRADKLAKTLPRVVAQTPVAAELGEDGEAALASALSALCGALTDDAQVKSLNLTLLMHTRDEEARVRLCALRVAAGLWQEHGDQLMGFTGETATFVAECAEDENDEVVRAARKLKEVAERATGEKMDV